MALGHRILVPLDASPFATRVLPFATTLAAHAGGSLHLLGVHRDVLPPSAPPGAAAMIAEANRHACEALTDYLERIGRELRDEGARVATEVRTGIPDLEILAAVGNAGCDLITMATHGRGGFRRAWLGSVADRVVRHADIPVLLVPLRGMEEGPDDSASEAPQTTIRTVIVPLDGSSFAEQILVPATSLGEAFAADYILYRSVAAPGVTGRLSAVEYSERAAQYLDHDRAEARAGLERTAGALTDSGFAATVTLVEDSEPAPALLRLAAATPDSVIAMTTHGRGGLRRAILGSVADKVVRGTNRPVLLLRPRGAE